MANLNKVMLIGRLTRDPQEILIGGARKGAKFGFAVNNRKLNQVTQQWEDEPVFIDCEIWDREPSNQGSRLFETVRKGQQLFIEGRLRFDSWIDKDAPADRNKRSALKVVVETFQYLEPRAEGAEGGQARAYAPRQQATAAPRQAAPQYNEDFDNSPPMGAPTAGGRGGQGDDDIPF